MEEKKLLIGNLAARQLEMIELKNDIEVLIRLAKSLDYKEVNVRLWEDGKITIDDDDKHKKIMPGLNEDKNCLLPQTWMPVMPESVTVIDKGGNSNTASFLWLSGADEAMMIRNLMVKLASMLN